MTSIGNYMMPPVEFCQDCRRPITQDEIVIDQYEQVHKKCGLVLSSVCYDMRPAASYDGSDNSHFYHHDGIGPSTRIGMGPGSFSLKQLNNKDHSADISRVVDDKHICYLINLHPNLQISEEKLADVSAMFDYVEKTVGAVQKHKRKALYTVVFYLMMQCEGDKYQRTLSEMQCAYDSVREESSKEPLTIKDMVEPTRRTLMSSERFGPALKKVCPSEKGSMFRSLQALSSFVDFDNIHQESIACNQISSKLEAKGVGQGVDSKTFVGAVIWFYFQNILHINMEKVEFCNILKCNKTTITKFYAQVEQALCKQT